MGRPKRGALSSALRSCAGVGGELEAVAVATLRKLFITHRRATYSETVHAVAGALAITPHALRRIARVLGVRLIDIDIEIAVTEAA